MIEFDDQALMAVAARLKSSLNVQAVLVTHVDDPVQYILVNIGLSLPEPLRRETPLEFSICQHVKAMNYPLVVDDAVSHPLVCNSPAVRSLGVGAYLGAPIHYAQGVALGAICAIEFARRVWSAEDMDLIKDAAEQVNSILDEMVH